MDIEIIKDDTAKNISENVKLNKIINVLTEPSKIYVDSTFKLKIKVNRAVTYSELKNKKYTEIQKYKYENLIKGV